MTLHQISVWALAAYPLVTLVLGIRLLLMWRRTRKLPELLFGIGFLFAGPIGNAALNLRSTPGPLQHAFSTYWGLVVIVIGNSGAGLSKLFAVWLIFRPQALWAKLVVAVMAVLLAGAALRWVTPYGFHAAFGYYGRSAVYAWMAAESFLYYERMRRRVRIGLGDPVVANRFWLWGMGSASSACVSLAWYLPVTFSIQSIDLEMRRQMIALFGFLAALFIWFAFYPPRFYLALFQRRDPRAAAALKQA